MLSLLCCMSGMQATSKYIRIETKSTDWIFKVADNQRLYQVYLGKKLYHKADLQQLSWQVKSSSDGSHPAIGHEVYPASGSEDLFEPAVAITHADGNQATFLYYKSHYSKAIDGGTETVISLADNQYPVEVILHVAAYTEENIIKTWSEIRHWEKRPITLWRYGSCMLYFNSNRYYLTSYSGDWAREAQPQTEQLLPGKKIIDTRLGTRTNMMMNPFFELGFDHPARENEGTVMLGTIGWTGNFRLTFEVDNMGILRVIPAINPYASDYQLKAGDTFTTPEFIFTFSQDGIGQASRNLHAWARRYQVKDGMGNRMTLLNNWENTGFDFDQKSLAELMKDAKDLGLEMFLLDDGWFGNKHPRKDDRAGLGDWQPNRQKLPGGIRTLTQAARTAGVKFGLWIEPEMVNPQSELYERHRDWIIEQSNRDAYLFRHQLVLDLSNPKVQDYVYGIVDRLLTENPDIAYFKWDCNSPITNAYSPWLKTHQGNLFIDYVRGLYTVLKRIQAKYPDLPMMLCSSGGARCDYEALKYFTEFWCSDNTDPFERLYIQWNMSKFFPVNTIAAHVTNLNRSASLKFRTDVSCMCRLGFDIDLKGLSPADYQFAKAATVRYQTLKPLILQGTQYRLLSPYESNHMAVDYVAPDFRKAVLFVYDLHPRFREPLGKVRLQGLDANKMYRIEEINRMPDRESTMECHEKVYSGDYLMKIGLNVLTAQQGSSHVFELTAE